MESRCRDPRQVGRAAQLVVDRGHMYVAKRKYEAMKVFSKDLMVMDLLRRCFGGNYYRHGVGYYWTLGHQADLKYMRECIEQYVYVEDREAV